MSRSLGAMTPEDVLAARTRLAGAVAATPCSHSNVLHIDHDRTFSRARVGESEVELTLETSGREQIEALKRNLAQAGYAVGEVTRGFTPTR